MEINEQMIEYLAIKYAEKKFGGFFNVDDSEWHKAKEDFIAGFKEGIELFKGKEETKKMQVRHIGHYYDNDDIYYLADETKEDFITGFKKGIKLFNEKKENKKIQVRHIGYYYDDDDIQYLADKNADEILEYYNNYLGEFARDYEKDFVEFEENSDNDFELSSDNKYGITKDIPLFIDIWEVI